MIHQALALQRGLNLRAKLEALQTSDIGLPKKRNRK